MVRDPKLVVKCCEIPVLAAADMEETLDAAWPSGDSTAVIRRSVRIRGWPALEIDPYSSAPATWTSSQGHDEVASPFRDDG